MAITLSNSGNWSDTSAAGPWGNNGDAAPAITDQVIVPTGMTLTMDAATMNCAGILIQGNGVVDMPYNTATGSYVLNCAHKISFNHADGRFTVGTASNPLNANVDFQLKFGANANSQFNTQTSYTIDSGNVLIYAQPLSDTTKSYAPITVAATLGGNTVGISSAIGAIWKAYFDGLHATGQARAKIFVTTGTKKARETVANCEYTISSIADAGGGNYTITITGTFAEAKPITTGYVVFATRNVLVSCDFNIYAITVVNRSKDTFLNCEFRVGAGAAHNSFSNGSGVTATGCVFASSGNSTYYYKNANLSNSVLTNGGDISFSSGINYTNCFVTGRVTFCQTQVIALNFTNAKFVGNASCFTGAQGIDVSNATFLSNTCCLLACADVVGTGVTVVGNTTGFQQCSGVLKSATFGTGNVNTTDLYSPTRQILDSSYIQGTTPVNMSTDNYSQALWAYVCSYNHNNVTGDIKAWSPGGYAYYNADGDIYFLDGSSEFTITNYGRTFMMVITAASPLWAFYEQEFVLRPGQKLELYSRMQESAVGAVTAKVELQLKGSDSFMYATGSPLVTNSITNNSTLQFVNQEYYNSDTKPVTVIARWMYQALVSDVLYFNFDYVIRG